MVKADTGWPGKDFTPIPVEFVEGLLKQAVNQWTGWMEKDSRHYVLLEVGLKL